MTQPMESIIQEDQEKRKLVILLNKIENLTQYYDTEQYTVHELKEKMKDIQAITARALAGI